MKENLNKNTILQPYNNNKNKKQQEQQLLNP